MDTTATSDFQNRFKGKIDMMKKDGHIGLVERISKPITKVNMDRIGFNSGMSGVSMITTKVPQYNGDNYPVRASVENLRDSNYR